MASLHSQILGRDAAKHSGGRLSLFISQKSSPTNKKNTIIFIVGPTGAGKTEIAIKLAPEINAEIASCDSMQIYKKMNIISQKPSQTLRRKIKHYLIDIISPEEEYNVADYQKQATLKIKDILKSGKVPLFVGGTGLYMNVLLEGLFHEDRKNRKIRNRLYSQVKEYGKEKFYERLIQVDPKAALKIHPNDVRRMIRALEVYEATKIPISELQRERGGIIRDYDVKIFCLNRERNELYKRIEARVDRMFRQGLIKEVKSLLDLKLSKTASQAIGIKEIRGYLEGQYDLGEAKRLIKRNTRQYAKRQLTWFRKDKRINWIGIADNEKSEDIANKILCQINPRLSMP